MNRKVAYGLPCWSAAGVNASLPTSAAGITWSVVTAVPSRVRSPALSRVVILMLDRVSPASASVKRKSAVEKV